MSETIDLLKTALSDRYVIEHELGAGGMATVYLAEDLKHHRKVAVKVLRPELAAAIGPERFLREITITAQLNHPHILPLLDSGEEDGFLYYVMPYMQGESLRDRLNREKQLSVGDAVKLAVEVADALNSAHKRGVVHRDIKPENILIEDGHAVVADFGIARAIDAAGSEQLTETGLAVGTPFYMSPEQASGSRDLDGRSDIYALGCVLYEMLAGQPPFTGPTIESVVHQHLAVEVSPVTNLRPAVSAEIAETLTRALAKTPADRFATAREFADALTEGTTSTAARPTTASGRRLRKHRWKLIEHRPLAHHYPGSARRYRAKVQRRAQRSISTHVPRPEDLRKRRPRLCDACRDLSVADSEESASRPAVNRRSVKRTPGVRSSGRDGSKE